MQTFDTLLLSHLRMPPEEAALVFEQGSAFFEQIQHQLAVSSGPPVCNGREQAWVMVRVGALSTCIHLCAGASRRMRLRMCVHV
eukprot:193664-Pelagomonas_calceolata.AAC.1